MNEIASGGVAVTLAAGAVAIALAVVKALIARAQRAPIESEERGMCRNHSHMTGVLLEAWSSQAEVGVEMLVTQDLTMELLSGEKLMVPRYCVCLVLRDDVTQSVGKALHEMVEQGGGELSREGSLFTFGHITRPK